MADFGAKWRVLRPILMIFLNFVLAFVFAKAERGLRLDDSRFSAVKENDEPSFLLKAANFLWQSDKLGYTHVWPDMKFGWQIVIGSIIGFFGAAFGSVGGVGGGGIFVPMLNLIIGFDAKSSTAISKCMIMGAAISTVYYNLKLRHPTIDMPIIDYDLALLIQPMLMLGISIGVAFNVIFADWMVTVLLIVLFIGTSTKAFFKGVDTWKKETIMKREAAKRLESNGDDAQEVEYKPLPSGPSSNPPKDNNEKEVSILENVYWKELGLLVFVWLAFLGLQIAKHYTTTCSVVYWVLNLLQIPVSVGVSMYEAVSLYQGRRVIASKGEDGKSFSVYQLVSYCIFGVLAGIVGGLLGLGGGFIMGPLFLELGVPPQVSSATATFAMTFSSSMSVVEYYLLKRFPVPYALYFVAVATVAAFVGQHIVRKLIILLGRASLIIFILAFMIFVSAISLGGVGIANMITKIENHDYMGFENLCKFRSIWRSWKRWVYGEVDGGMSLTFEMEDKESEGVADSGLVVMMMYVCRSFKTSGSSPPDHLLLRTIEKGGPFITADTTEPENYNNNILSALEFLWQPNQSGYQHVWPETEFGWRIIVGTIIGFLGAAFGSVGGVGGGGIFVPMLSLIIGFDPKSGTAISKCMIFGAAVSTVYYNLKLRHPTLDMPIIDYDLVLIIQPILMLGISIGVALNVIFADWMVTVLLITLCIVTAIKAFFKGVDTWKTETRFKEEAAKRFNSSTTGVQITEYKPLPGGPSSNHIEKRLQVTVLENIYWKELGLLTFVWVAYLALQIAKNYTATCSTAYWVLNLLQIPVSIGVFLYEAVGLYKGRRAIASKGDEGKNLRMLQLVQCFACGLVAGIVGGMLGLGGGFIMGPMFLELGIHPQVASATATLGMTFSASMSVVEFYLLNRFPVPYALYFIAVAFVAAFIGQYIITKLIAITGRASLIIFVLSFTIFVSAITLGGVGLSDMIRKIKQSDYMGFENLCKV
ncbi:hypothetical protein LWI29_027458 [Acer saccharum]|uniref:Sulfite exporter TauE/SafE family protein n=1 Tax=Acer saccharum TaxID=4024 RepID=A0AA39RDZ8_ACESA|nr:hypothetical protein LWI29_027458 [Acer saccharum]